MLRLSDFRMKIPANKYGLSFWQARRSALASPIEDPRF